MVSTRYDKFSGIVVPKGKKFAFRFRWNAYLIPYKNKGTYECQFQIGYKGLIDLAYRNGQMQTIQAQSVYENDYFEYEFGLEPKLVHRPAFEDRGEVTYFYGLFRTVNGGYGFSVMSKVEMDAYPYENVTYYNIHTFISEYAQSNEDLSDADKRAEVLEGISWDDINFDDVVIDEGQDFHNEEIVYFKEFAEIKEGHFFVFYDKNQVVMTEEVPKWIRDSECKLLLTKNCRNTYEIALTAYNVIDVELNQKIQMMNGDKTNLIFAKGDPISKLSKLLNLLTGDRCGYEYGDIVILSLKTEKESIFNNIHKISGIPITREKSNSSVLFTTAKKFKGLESRSVIIIDIDESSFSNEKKKRDFYVACSRATQNLSLIISGDDAKLKDIADAIGGTAHFAPKGKIAMKTQANIIDLA